MSHSILLPNATPEILIEATPKSTEEEQGVLKTESSEHIVTVFKDTEESSRGVSQFLQKANDPKLFEGEDVERNVMPLLDAEIQEIDQEIAEMEVMLKHPDEQEKQAPLEKTNKEEPKQIRAPLNKQVKKEETKKEPIRHASLFSLARDLHLKASSAKPQPKLSNTSKEKKEVDKRDLVRSYEEPKHKTASHPAFAKKEVLPQPQRQPMEREGGGQGKQQQQEKEPKELLFKRRAKLRQKSQPVSGIQRIRASTVTSKSESQTEESSAPNIESIYVRFMALMARILGQAEAEAHNLYAKVKERTDSIDVLTLLLSKINSEKKEIDWSKNEEMKSLVDKVRSLGVEIPEGKVKWNEDEKRLLKENIQMRKDSMEKMTQLERTDMQRYMQEVSQCHQARSNVLKLMKEVLDTIIHNMRGG